MKVITTIAALMASLAMPAYAQQAPDGHGAHHPTVAASAADMSEGEVRKVDQAARKLTIKHGEIKNLGMPAMTMVFQAKDGVMLDALKAGDKIRFVAEQAPSGLVVTDIQLAR